MDQISLSPMARPDSQLFTPNSLKSTDNPQKIQDAARQFEGLLLSQLLESAHEDGGWLGTGSDSSSSAAMSFGQQQLASMIAQNGGLGLAGMISVGLQQRAAEQATAPDPSAAPPSRP